jgi:hypothetical protein
VARQFVLCTGESFEEEVRALYVVEPPDEQDEGGTTQAVSLPETGVVLRAVVRRVDPVRDHTHTPGFDAVRLEVGDLVGGDRDVASGVSDNSISDEPIVDRFKVPRTAVDREGPGGAHHVGFPQPAREQVDHRIQKGPVVHEVDDVRALHGHAHLLKRG